MYLGQSYHGIFYLFLAVGFYLHLKCLVVGYPTLVFIFQAYKVRSPIPWIYGGFYTMYYQMILTVVLEWKFDVDKHHCYQHLSCKYQMFQYLSNTLFKSHHIPMVLGILPQGMLPNISLPVPLIIQVNDALYARPTIGRKSARLKIAQISWH